MYKTKLIELEFVSQFIEIFKVLLIWLKKQQHSRITWITLSDIQHATNIILRAKLEQTWLAFLIIKMFLHFGNLNKRILAPLVTWGCFPHTHQKISLIIRKWQVKFIFYLFLFCLRPNEETWLLPQNVTDYQDRNWRFNQV